MQLMVSGWAIVVSLAVCQRGYLKYSTLRRGKIIIDDNVIENVIFLSIAGDHYWIGLDVVYRLLLMAEAQVDGFFAIPAPGYKSVSKNVKLTFNTIRIGQHADRY